MRNERDYFNLTLNKDLLPKIKEAKKKIKEETGFEPSHSQTITYLLHKIEIKSEGKKR